MLAGGYGDQIAVIVDSRLLDTSFMCHDFNPSMYCFGVLPMGGGF